MISRGEDVEAEALKKRGWSTSAIARHLGRDRKTIRAYLRGERQAGVRRSTQPDALEPYREYLAARFTDNAHLGELALRRGGSARLRGLVRELRPPAAPGGAASPLRGVRRGGRPGADRDRAPGGGGDSVGLVRASAGSLGRHRLRAARGAVALPAPPGRGPRAPRPAP